MTEEWRPPKDAPGGKLFVLSGSSTEFNVWCHRHRLNPRSGFLAAVSNLRELEGIPERFRFVILPGFHSASPGRRDQMWAFLEHRQAVRVWERDLW